MKLKIERISAFDSLLFLSYNSYLVGFHPLHWPQRVFVDLTHRHTAEKKKKSRLLLWKSKTNKTQNNKISAV